LFVAPHADDEFLAAGGTLLKLAALGAEILPVLCANHGGDRWLEFQKTAHQYTKQVPRMLLGSHCVDGHMDIISRMEIVTALDRVLADWQPQVLFAPAETAHQDHEAIGRACKAACRDCSPFKVPIRLDYAYPALVGDGALYVDITGQCEQKLRLWREIYASQCERGGLYSDMAIAAEHRCNGFRAGCEFAEIFTFAGGVW